MFCNLIEELKEKELALSQMTELHQEMRFKYHRYEKMLRETQETLLSTQKELKQALDNTLQAQGYQPDEVTK